MRFIQSLKLAGLLSFPPEMEPFELESLNVLIGPNGSGKSNLIEAFELLKALPTDFAAVIRKGGGADEWIWKGSSLEESAQIEVIAVPSPGSRRIIVSPTGRPIRYALAFHAFSTGAFISFETIEDQEPFSWNEESIFYYRSDGHRAVLGKSEAGEQALMPVTDQNFSFYRSILNQRRDPLIYPEIMWISNIFSEIQTFREWSFGQSSHIRRPQPTDLPDDYLLRNSTNLALMLNRIEHSNQYWRRFNDLLRRFFPRFERITTKISGATVQFFLHETGFDTPIPATRISDGTLRFIAMLAVLLSPEPPPLVCIEEPELGLHPDAVMVMGDVLKEASERMQLVVTTHSNALVSAFDDRANAIVTCERPGAGTVLRRLDPDALADLLETYSLGRLWRQGELGANP